MNLEFNRLLQGKATLRQRPAVGGSACILPTSHLPPYQPSHKKRQAVIEDEQELRSIVSHHIDRVARDTFAHTRVVQGGDRAASEVLKGQSNPGSRATVLLLKLLKVFASSEAGLSTSELVERIGSEVEVTAMDVFVAMIFMRRHNLITRCAAPARQRQKSATYTITAKGRRWIKFKSREMVNLTKIVKFG